MKTNFNLKIKLNIYTTTRTKMNTYYVIPNDIMENIAYYATEDVLSGNLSIVDYENIHNLRVEEIHSNKNNVIEKFLEIFQNALYDLEGESFDEEQGLEDRVNIYEIIEALKKRKQAIYDITIDVLKKREECCSC